MYEHWLLECRHRKFDSVGDRRTVISWMRDVVDDPRMSGLTAFDWLERCRYKESTRETV